MPARHPRFIRPAPWRQLEALGKITSPSLNQYLDRADLQRAEMRDEKTWPSLESRDRELMTAFRIDAWVEHAGRDYIIPFWAANFRDALFSRFDS